VAVKGSVYRLNELLDRLRGLASQLGRAHENAAETRRLALAVRQRVRKTRRAFRHRALT
jgi:hypothetical protein